MRDLNDLFKRPPLDTKQVEVSHPILERKIAALTPGTVLNITVRGTNYVIIAEDDMDFILDRARMENDRR